MSSEVQAPMPRISLDLFSEIHQSQLANGIRQRNFLRYRAYCSRRLRRLRKSVRFTHGKGKFVQKTLEPSMVSNVRHLLIIVNLCERAWSHAMEIKVDVNDKSNRSRFHMRRRLSKAMKWAEHLVHICEHTADVRTHLQAESYSSWMSGNVYLEKEEIGKALAAFSHSLKVLESLLGLVDKPSQQEIYQARIQALQPSIRYCQYKNKQENLGATDLSSMDDLDVVLSSKLEAARLEREQQIAANAVDHISWNGLMIPIKSDAVKTAVAKAVDLVAGITESTPVNAILACFDVLDVTRSVITTCLNSSDVSEPDKKSLELLLQFVAFNKTKVTLHRNIGLFTVLSSQINQASSKVTADDLIVICEKILANFSSIETQNCSMDVHSTSLFRAHRYYYMALKLSSQSEWAGASHFLQNSIDSYPKEEKAFILRSRQELIRTRMSTLSVGETQEIDSNAVPLLERLPYWSEGPGLILEIPPPFACTTCKPVQFDLAAAGLVYPDMDNKLSRRPAASGWLSRLWG
uniref:Signal recognition particle subunit SRP68 n=1 Tax=Spongospora subterranea TaxID=70186 RepID=A0A0H5R5V3_9EUKA|eukprot:CRZ09503.1 hypothetical protein [Spongospora subterranea]